MTEHYYPHWQRKYLLRYAIGLCALMASAGVFLHERRKREHAAAYAPHDQADQAKPAVSRVTLVSNSEQNTPDGNDKSAQILNQATRQANWTKYAVIVAAMALFFSVFGVGLVYSTLKATKHQVRIAADTETRQLRAYVGMKFGSLPDKDQKSYLTQSFGDGSGNFLYIIKNFGLTPARHVKHKVIVDVAATNKDPKFAITDQVIDNVPTDTVVFPQDIIGAVAPFNLSAADARDASSGTTRKLYVVGVVRYEDFFGTTHHLHFCGVWLGEAFGSLAIHSFPNCPDGNDTD